MKKDIINNDFITSKKVINSIIHKHGKSLTVYARSLARSFRSFHLDENDLLQDFYLKILEKPNIYTKIKESDNQISYLFSILKHDALNVIKKNENRLNRETQIFFERFEYDIHTTTSLTEKNIKDFLDAFVTDEVDKKIMSMRIQGYKYKEIADVLNIPANHIGVKINRMKGKIQKQLVDEGYL